MAGESASKAVPFALLSGPLQRTGHVIQIKARTAPDPNDAARPPGRTAGLTAPEETQP